MSLVKAIASGKEHRKPYRKSKAFDRSCQNKTCSACTSNAMNSINKQMARTKEMEKEA